MRIARMREKCVKQGRSLRPMGRQRRLDERDRPPDGGSVTSKDTSGKIGSHPSTLPRMRTMIRHHVLITLHDDAKDTVADQIVNELATYGPTCRTVRTYAVGRDLALAEGTATVAVVAEFDDVEGYQFYAQDPAHVDIIERLIKPNAANLVRAQTAF